MTATVGDIIEAVQTAIGEAAGPGVQEYGEDRLRADVVRAFNILFKKYHWDQYREWFTLELDETTGTAVSNDLQNILDFEDIYKVTKHGSDSRIPMLPKNRNPNSISGTNIQCFRALHVNHTLYATKRIQILPIVAAGSIDVGARVYPTLINNTWIDDDTMYLDKDMLVYGSAFLTLIGDDTNPGAADAMRQLMEMRFRDITASLADHPIATSGYSSIPLDDWRVA